MEESTWVQQIPGGKWPNAVRVVPIHQATELGEFGFRNWTVKLPLPDDEESTYPGALWDPEKRVWWGWDEDLEEQEEYVVYWDGPEPPQLAEEAKAARCPNCDFLIKTSEGENGKCPNCGYSL